MTTTNLLADYWADLPDGTPVLILMPNGDKLACSPTVDADGTLVLVLEGLATFDETDVEIADLLDECGRDELIKRVIKERDALRAVLAKRTRSVQEEAERIVTSVEYVQRNALERIARTKLIERITAALIKGADRAGGK